MRQRFWKEKWDEGTTRWDLGKPHPLIESLLDRAVSLGFPARDARFLVPGCGRAHDGAYLAKRNYDVVSEDIVPKAIEEAKKYYSTLSNLTLRTADFFEVLDEDKNAFDGIYDRAMLCAMPPDMHVDFLNAAADRLKVGGMFLSIPFHHLNGVESGPPFAIALEKMKELLSLRFEVLFIEPSKSGAMSEVVTEELLVIAKKK